MNFIFSAWPQQSRVKAALAHAKRGNGNALLRLAEQTEAPPKTCQWIEGDPAPDRLNAKGKVVWSCKCGKPSKPGKPYCEKHCKRAYVIVDKPSVSTEVGLDEGRITQPDGTQARAGGQNSHQPRRVQKSAAA